MKVYRLTCFLFLFSAAFSGNAFSAGEVSETGKTGMSFLKIVPTARIASLGGGTVAFDTGAGAIWSNPALMIRSRERRVGFTHIEWVEGITQQFAAFAAGSDVGSFGIGMQVFDSDDIELRGPNPSSEPEGTYSIKNAAFILGYALEVKKDVAVGISMKRLFEKVSMETAYGYAFDFGVSAGTVVDGLSVGVVARNYGRMGKLKNERTKLPSDVCVGFMYDGDLPVTGKSAVLVGDYVMPRYGDSGVRLGVEIEPVERFFVRTGYRTDSDIEGVSFGVGLAVRMLSFDVSYTPMKEGFEDALRFTLCLTGF